MTPTAFAAALDALNLSQVQFARLTGMTNGTVSRWVRGVLPVPLWAERLLDAWASCPEALERARGGINKGE